VFYCVKIYSQYIKLMLLNYIAVNLISKIYTQVDDHLILHLPIWEVAFINEILKMGTDFIIADITMVGSYVKVHRKFR